MEKDKGRTILIVEDEPSINLICSKVLTKEGHKVDIATNAKIAQDILGIWEYDLCLIDIRTPYMNGIELYQWLTENHPSQAERVIFTSGDVQNEDIENTIALSTKRFLPKPFTTEELKAAVSEFFEEGEK
jgi:CheY-like chemotaxis protein